MADAGKQPLRQRAPDEQRKEVERQHQQRRVRADPEPLHQKKGQPPRQRPLIAELEKQQQRKQDGGGVAYVVPHVPPGNRRWNVLRRETGAEIDVDKHPGQQGDEQ